MKPGQLKKSEREALGRLQVVRVQYESALGSLADWLQAPQPLEGKGAVRRKSREPGGVLMGSTFPHLTPGLHWQEVAPSQIQHTCHELPALNFSTPSPSSSSPGSWSKPCYRHEMVTLGVLGGEVGGWSLNSEQRFHTAAHPIPFPAREGLKGRGRGTYCLAEIEVGVSLLIKNMVEQVVRHPQPQREA